MIDVSDAESWLTDDLVQLGAAEVASFNLWQGQISYVQGDPVATGSLAVINHGWTAAGQTASYNVSLATAASCGPIICMSQRAML